MHGSLCGRTRRPWQRTAAGDEPGGGAPPAARAAPQAREVRSGAGCIWHANFAQQAKPGVPSARLQELSAAHRRGAAAAAAASAGAAGWCAVRARPGQAGAACRAGPGQASRPGAVRPCWAFQPCARVAPSWHAETVAAAAAVAEAVAWCGWLALGQHGCSGGGRAAHARLRVLERVLLLEGSRLGLRLPLRPRGLGLLLLSSLRAAGQG